MTVEQPTPTPSASLPVVSKVGFNHRYGDSALAAADAFDLQRRLFSAQQYWEVAMSTRPQAAGDIERTDPAKVRSARAAATGMVLVIATENLRTISGLLSGGDTAQQSYCTQIVEQLRALGYSGLTKVTLFVYFTEQDRHAQLTWTPAAGYAYTVYDNDLRNARFTLPPSSTPFGSVPTP